MTPEQRQAAIAYVTTAVAAASSAIEGQTWWWWEGDAKAQQLGAVAIVGNTTIPEMQRLAAAADDADDAKLVDLGHTAEQSLSAIRGYAASATFDSVVAATASATAKQSAELATSAAAAVAKIIPWQVWGVLGAAGVVLGLIYLPRPRKAAAA